MRNANRLHSVLSVVAIFWGFSPSLAVAANCPPKDLKPNSAAVNDEAISFSFRSRLYPASVLSAFTRPDSAAANYCIRYEVVSRAQAAIEKFYWPLAGMQIDTISPGERFSLAITKPPGRDPTIDETWIYAFLNAQVRTYAFQRRAETPMPTPIRVALGASDNRNEVTKLNMQLSATDAVEQRLELKEPTKFSEVSAEFSSGDVIQISSTSEAFWDGKSPQINLSLGIYSEKTSVLAPIAYALAKALSGPELLDLIREISSRQTPLPFDKDNKFRFSKRFSPENFSDTKALYVIEEPIYLITPNGKSCISSPIYSPVPIPGEFLQCRLF
jgi:hypothetical protein